MAQSTSPVTWLVAGLILVGAASGMMGDKKPSTDGEARAAKVKQEARDRLRKESEAIGLARATVRTHLKDPDSAKFGSVVYRPSGAVCGYVNGKNSFGAYVGEKAFFFLSSNQAFSLDDGSAAFADKWNTICTARRT